MEDKGCVALCKPGWAEPVFARLLPGAHVGAVGSYPECIEARRAGFEIRDTILVLTVGGPVFAFLLRKPPVGTVAENALQYGTGALHINACRVNTQGEQVPFFVNEGGKKFGVSEGYPRNTTGGFSTDGRWPPNLVLVHGPGCRQEGPKKVRGTNAPGPGKSPTGRQWCEGSGLKPRPGHCFTDADGTETVISWACEPGCPVGDLGGSGAARFYPQFENLADFHEWLARLIGLTPRQTEG